MRLIFKIDSYENKIVGLNVCQNKNILHIMNNKLILIELIMLNGIYLITI